MTTAPTPPSALFVRASPLAGVCLVIFLAGGLLSCAWLLYHGNIPFMPARVSADSLMHGEITHKFAKELAKAPLPHHAAELERGTSWWLFEDTGPRVRQGCPGWLFLADELTVNRNAAENSRAKAAAVITLQQQLAQRNIQLLVSVIPDKTRIASDRLCGLHRPAMFVDRIKTWLDTLQAAGVATLDLTNALQSLGSTAFLRTDTHWSESGAQQAAQAVAKRVLSMGIAPHPTTPFEQMPGTSRPRPGDLVRLAGLDGLPARFQPEGENATTSLIHQQLGASNTSNPEALFGDVQLPNIALIGTSYSRNSNFGSFLELALSAPIGHFAKDGGEFSGAAKAYFASLAFKQSPPTLLIWEIPERDLQTPYLQDLPVTLNAEHFPLGPP